MKKMLILDVHLADGLLDHGTDLLELIPNFRVAPRSYGTSRWSAVDDFDGLENCILECPFQEFGITRRFWVGTAGETI